MDRPARTWLLRRTALFTNTYEVGADSSSMPFHIFNALLARASALSSIADSSHLTLSKYSTVILRLELGLRCCFLSDHVAFCMAEFNLLVTRVRLPSVLNLRFRSAFSSLFISLSSQLDSHFTGIICSTE